METIDGYKLKPARNFPKVQVIDACSELFQMVETILMYRHELSDWEYKNIETARDQLNRYSAITKRKYQVMRKIWEKYKVAEMVPKKKERKIILRKRKVQNVGC